MTSGTISLILISVSLSALAQVSFKFGVASASGRADYDGIAEMLYRCILTPGVLGGLALYCLGTLLWLDVLRQVDVSQAYPFIGLGIALTALLGYALFGESLGPQRIFGMLLVIGGITIIAGG